MVSESVYRTGRFSMVNHIQEELCDNVRVTLTLIIGVRSVIPLEHQLPDVNIWYVDGRPESFDHHLEGNLVFKAVSLWEKVFEFRAMFKSVIFNSNE